MRVLFLIRSLDIGGAQRQLVNLANGLARLGTEVAVVVFYSGGELERDLVEPGIRIRPAGKNGRWDVAGFLLRLMRLIRTEQPDVIHSYLPTANVLSAMFKPMVRPARVVWGVRAANVDFSQYDWLARLDFRLTRLLAKRADLIIANSRAGRDWHVAQGYPADKFVVIPNGIDTDRFRPDGALRARQRAAWGVADGAPLLGLVGRLDPVKDHDAFLRAAAQILQDRRDARFVCIGDGPADYRERLLGVAVQLGIAQSVLWVRAMSDMPAAYNALDLLVNTSIGEGFSNAISEAMACGVPCVVTDVGDSRDIVGDTGAVVPPGNPEALARQCGRLLRGADTDAGALRAQARARIVERYGLAALARETRARLLSLRSGALQYEPS